MLYEYAKSYTTAERYDMIVVKKYCINCLARNHTHENCYCDLGRRKCTRRHNTLLHGAPQLSNSSNGTIDKNTTVTSQRRKSASIKSVAKEVPRARELQQDFTLQRPKRQEKATQTTQVEIQPYNRSTVFITTATVKIARHNESNNWYNVRALLNTSATTSTIAATCVKRLGLPIQQQGRQVFSEFSLRSRHPRHKWVQKIIALITDDLPRRPYAGPIQLIPTEEFSDDAIADLDPRSNKTIEIELAADVYSLFRRDGAIELDMGQVVAYKSALGYLFSGPV